MINSDSEYLENCLISFAFGIEELDIVVRRLFKSLDKLPRLLIDLVIRIDDIEPRLNISVLHGHSNAKEKGLLVADGLRADGAGGDRRASVREPIVADHRRCANLSLAFL